MSECQACENADPVGCRIVEYHTPFGDMAGKYPILLRMEEQMFERILGVPVKRREERASALVRFVFDVGIS